MKRQGFLTAKQLSRQRLTLPKEIPTKVLGEVSGEKRIYVDLATQTLSAYQGDTLFMQVLVSIGKWGRTPTGEFTIWEKVRSTKMSGGSGATYYYLPNVPFVMFFSNAQISAGRGSPFMERIGTITLAIQ